MVIVSTWTPYKRDKRAGGSFKEDFRYYKITSWVHMTARVSVLLHTTRSDMSSLHPLRHQTRAGLGISLSDTHIVLHSRLNACPTDTSASINIDALVTASSKLQPMRKLAIP
jgi:hypothetical protein